MISLTSLLTNTYSFRNYTKELRNVKQQFRLSTDKIKQNITKNTVENIDQNAGVNKNINIETHDTVVNYIEGNTAVNKAITNTFQSTPDAVLSKYGPITKSSIPEIFQEITTNHPQIHMCFVDENQKNISIYRPSLQEGIHIVLLLQKNDTYAIFEYPKSSFVNLKKSWDYTRVPMEGETPCSKITKKQLIEFAKNKSFDKVKSNMKKADIYNAIYQQFFGFH